MAEASAPGTPVVERVPRNDGPRFSMDSAADDILSFLSDEQPAKQAKQGKPPAEQPAQSKADNGPREITLPDEPDDIPEADEPVDEPGDDREDPETDEHVDEPVEHEQKVIIGTKENPYPGKDLPDDRFATVTVDGEQEVVSFKEMARAYTHQATASRRLNAAQVAVQRAEEIANKAAAYPEKLRTQLEGLFGDDQQLFEFLLERDENLLLRVAQRAAARAKFFRENPNAAEHERLQRTQKQLEKQREALAEKARQDDQQRQAREVFEQRKAVFLPGWQAGLKRMGFPKLSETQAKELYEEVNMRCGQRNAAGREVTSAEVSDFVVRSCRALEIAPANGAAKKPAPAQIAPREPVVERRNGNGKKDWKSVPQYRRNQDPDFLLSGLNTRDFRR